VSGAGRKAEIATLFLKPPTVQGLRVGGHRHLPEIKQGLSRVVGKEVGLTFVPHLTPMIRGIHATLYGKLTGDVDLQACSSNVMPMSLLSM